MFEPLYTSKYLFSNSTKKNYLKFEIIGKNKNKKLYFSLTEAFFVVETWYNLLVVKSSKIKQFYRFYNIKY